MPILETWEARTSLEIPNYAAGMWGPENAEALIAREGHTWAVHTPANGQHKPAQPPTVPPATGA